MTILTSLLGTKALGFLILLWQEAATSPAAGGGGDAGSQFTITEMLKHLGGVAMAVVIILLVIMSVYSIAIMVGAI